jgi:hypothetical protein
VISVRVPRELKEELERLGVNYAEAIRGYLEELVRREKARRLLREIEEFRRSLGEVGGNFSAEALRRERDER